MIKVTADSTCDLSKELTEKYNIGIIPLYVVLDGVAKLDGIEITPADLFNHVEGGGELGSTAAVSVADYIDYFTKCLKEADEVIHFTISSDMSACYQNCVLAAEEFGGRVHPVDSRNLSTGIGLLVLEAAEMAAAGKTSEEICAVVEEKKSRLNVSFVINTLKYLHKGGRCSTIAALGANLLSLRPCIEVKEGKMGVGKKYRGDYKKCLVNYIKDKLSGKDDVETGRIFITHSEGITEEEFEAVKAQVEALQPFAEILRTTAGCTISNHCGPGTLGILYFNK